MFSENFFAPFVYVQNDQRIMGIILRYVCWGTPKISNWRKMGSKTLGGLEGGGGVWNSNRPPPSD